MEKERGCLFHFALTHLNLFPSQYFAEQLVVYGWKPSMRYRLATIFKQLTDKEWAILDEELAELIDFDEKSDEPCQFDIKNTTTAKIVAQIQSDVPKLLAIDSSDEKAIEDLQ